MKYRVYSDDNAPDGWGVQAIVYEHPDVGWAMATNGDFYIRRRDRWFGADKWGLLDYLCHESGIALVHERRESGRYWLEFEVMIDNQPHRMDWLGLVYYAVTHLDTVMAGRTISNAEFQRIYQRAKKDRDFANKTAYLPGERKP